MVSLPQRKNTVSSDSLLSLSVSSMTSPLLLRMMMQEILPRPRLRLLRSQSCLVIDEKNAIQWNSMYRCSVKNWQQVQHQWLWRSIVQIGYWRLSGCMGVGWIVVRRMMLRGCVEWLWMRIWSCFWRLGLCTVVSLIFDVGCEFFYGGFVWITHSLMIFTFFLSCTCIVLLFLDPHPGVSTNVASQTVEFLPSIRTLNQTKLLHSSGYL